MSTPEVLSMMEFRGQQAVRHAEFSLPSSAESAFSLFTPKGLSSWMASWDPTPIYPAEMVCELNTVFEVFQEGERSIWTIVEADNQAMVVDYVSFVFMSRIARLRVQVTATGEESCRVNIAYTATGFTDAGDRIVEDLTDEVFSRKMQRWQRNLTKALNSQTKSPLPHAA